MEVQHCRCMVLLSGGSSAELEVLIGISIRFSFRESEMLGCIALLVFWRGAAWRRHGNYVTWPDIWRLEEWLLLRGPKAKLDRHS